MDMKLAMVYADGLYQLARELDQVEPIREELASIDGILSAQPEFRELLNNPGISRSDRKEALRNVFDGKMIQEVLNFLYLLIDKKRMGEFSSIVKEYDKRIDEDNKIGKGEIYSVVPLTEAQLGEFEKKTGEVLHKNVTLINRIEPGLIGGVKILVDGKMIDASYRKELERLTAKILNS